MSVRLRTSIGFSCKNKCLSLYPRDSRIRKKSCEMKRIFFGARVTVQPMPNGFFFVRHIAPDVGQCIGRHRPGRQKSADPVEHIHGLIVIYEPRYKVLSNTTFTVAYTVVKFLPSVLRKGSTVRKTTKHGTPVLLWLSKLMVARRSSTLDRIILRLMNDRSNRISSAKLRYYNPTTRRHPRTWIRTRACFARGYE